MSLINKSVLISFVFLCPQFAHGDTADENIAKACTGLSQVFYNMSETSSDTIDEEILKKILGLDPEIATMLNRAKVIGAARACGEQTDDQWGSLKTKAAKAVNDSPPLSERFMQVIECTKVRFEKVGLTGNWAVTTLEFCPQAKQNFTFYVRDHHEFSEKAPQLYTKKNN